MDDSKKAANFAKMARADWEAGMTSSVPYSICFHAQQAAEKYLKAFLAFHGQAAPKSHNIEDLIRRCAEIDTSFSALLGHAGALQFFGVEIRYQPTKEVAEDKCSQAWSAMTAIFEATKAKLPEAIISGLVG